MLHLLQNIPGNWKGKYRVVAVVPRKLAEKLPPGLAVDVLTPGFPARSLVHRVLWFWFWLPRLLKDLTADVLFCPGGSLATHRLSGARSAVAHQNMLPFDSAERKRISYGYIRAKLWLLRFVQGASFRDADLTIFISNYAKSAIDLCIPRRRGKSVVIPHGVGEHFRKRAINPPQPLEGVEYVLYVSKLDFYKAQLEVIIAWAQLRQRRQTPEKLVLVGPEYPRYGRRIRRLVGTLGLQDEVRVLGDIPYTELPSYYQHAKINLFASSCEIGASFVLIEALAGGRPVLCSNYPPMPEAAEDAAAYFDPYDPERLAVLLARYLDDKSLRDRMGFAAFKQSQKYQWRDTALRTWTALAELAG